jgi:hypothetical protein
MIVSNLAPPSAPAALTVHSFTHCSGTPRSLSMRIDMLTTDERRSAPHMERPTGAGDTVGW